MQQQQRSSLRAPRGAAPGAALGRARAPARPARMAPLSRAAGNGNGAAGGRLSGVADPAIGAGRWGGAAWRREGPRRRLAPGPRPGEGSVHAEGLLHAAPYGPAPPHPTPHARTPELVDGAVTSGPDLSVVVNGIRFPNPFVIGSGPPGTNYQARGSVVREPLREEGWRGDGGRKGQGASAA
jgi:hypothetical protein